MKIDTKYIEISSIVRMFFHVDMSLTFYHGHRHMLMKTLIGLYLLKHGSIKLTCNAKVESL